MTERVMPETVLELTQAVGNEWDVIPWAANLEGYTGNWIADFRRDGRFISINWTKAKGFVCEFLQGTHQVEVDGKKLTRKVSFKTQSVGMAAIVINRFLKDGMCSWTVLDLGRKGDWLEAKER